MPNISCWQKYFNYLPDILETDGFYQDFFTKTRGKDFLSLEICLLKTDFNTKFQVRSTKFVGDNLFSDRMEISQLIL